MNKSYKFGTTTTVDKETMDKLLCKGSKPQSTEITMKVSDIKTITDEDLETVKPKEEYDKLLLKVYWYLRGMNAIKIDEGLLELIEEIEDFI